MHDHLFANRLLSRGAGFLRSIPSRLSSRLYVGAPRRCVLCDGKIGRFLPYRGGLKAVPRLMVALDVIGSDVDHFECPRCGAHDRERHVLLYMRASGLFAGLGDRAVLHFAPEVRLSRLIRSARPARYVACDLFPTSEDIMRVDMLDMPFEDESFDLVMANHVLEHVGDDRRAISEIRRVLKPGGHAILQTPYSAALVSTWEDAGIQNPAARTQAYGQDDHVRLFGRDIFDRFVAGGLESRVETHEKLLSGVNPDRFGVNAREPFFHFARAA